jgi:purine-nucleoside phosphorylase
VIALSAVPADATARHYVNNEPHAPTCDFGLTHGAIHAAKGLGIQPHVGAIASSDTFYDPDPGRHLRWAERGVLAVEMEAAVLFTIGALRGVKTACILTVSDLVGSTQMVRIGDEDLANGVERMTRLALAAAVDPKA